MNRNNSHIGTIMRAGQKGHVDLLVKLTPNAASDTIIGVVDTAGSEKRLAIKIRAAPEKGRANLSLIAFLANRLGMPKSALSIAAGTTHRQKTVRITGNRPKLVKKLTGLLG